MRIIAIALLCGALMGISGQSRADVFNLSHFVNPGEFAIGIEPELTLTSGAGMGVNARYTQGLTELFDVSGMIGTGGGPRQFRVGGDLDFDIFPDLDKQPGIGLATRAMFIRVPTPGADLNSGSLSGLIELTAIPYIHKGFNSSGTLIDPFFSVPFGMSFLDGQYKALATAVVGAMIQGSEHLWYNVEFGIAINHTESYFSGGLTYYH